jgi:NADH-quinone oxidoreductase subunit H
MIEILLISFVLLNLILLFCTWFIWFERKLAARFQNRVGPSVVGPFGLLQSIADLIKLLQKEDTKPKQADAILFYLAPLLSAVLSLSPFAIIPLFHQNFFHQSIAQIDISILLYLSLSSLIVIPTWMAGWGSHNKYALLGAMRAISQSISLEIPMLMSALIPVIMSGSLNIAQIMDHQNQHGALIFQGYGIGFLAFLIFYLASLGEANRIPFDIPEAESELISGVSTEYSGMKFGLIYLAEYVHTVLSSLIASALFLGGFNGLFGGFGLHWLIIKALLLILVIYWLRWSFLRLRADQLLKLSWYYLLPFSLILMLLTAIGVVL